MRPIGAGPEIAASIRAEFILSLIALPAKPQDNAPPSREALRRGLAVALAEAVRILRSLRRDFALSLSGRS
jgi:hypothetical protein